MEPLHLFFLSLIQGLTEFLPVSSSGHLVLFPHIFGHKDQGQLIDVALHIGTLLAILVYYRRDIINIIVAVVLWKRVDKKADRNLGFCIALGSIPAVLVGFSLYLLFPGGIRSIGLITFNMIFFALVMGLADTKSASDKGLHDMTFRAALLIGCAQALALVPGVSRSGMTMTAARFLKFGRVDAARFSFLLGIPAMSGAGLLALLGLVDADNPGMLQDAAIAVVLAFFAGLGAIHFMMRWLKHAGLMPFVWYRLALGTFLIVFFFWPVGA
jgi:undecaprenyl-diphosphatase